ncbi:MAG TPA: permease [Bacillales bacterium]|nr:permease [Bacillales bacterium]
MNQPTVKIENNQGYRKQWMIGLIVFLLAVVAGLFWAKWHPYFYKAFSAAANHSIGSSVITGDSESAPPPSWSAAWDYSLGYFKSIWEAFVVGIVLASFVQVLIPRDWIKRTLGKTSYGSTMLAGITALPGMMCTCCSAPLVVGLRRQQTSVSAAVAFWFGNTALNPAVLIFMFFVLGWKFTLLRMAFGLILVFGLSYLVGKLVRNEEDARRVLKQTEAMSNGRNFNEDPKQGLFVRWLKSLGTMSLTIIPAYIISVFVLGAFRAWLFPALGGTMLGNSVLAVLLLALAGTLFVIPTAGEIPIAQTFMKFGLGSGPAAALIITLPVISLPSALMVRRAFSWRTLGLLGIGVAVLGFFAGLIGMVWI